MARERLLHPLPRFRLSVEVRRSRPLPGKRGGRCIRSDGHYNRISRKTRWYVAASCGRIERRIRSGAGSTRIVRHRSCKVRRRWSKCRSSPGSQRRTGSRRIESRRRWSTADLTILAMVDGRRPCPLGRQPERAADGTVVVRVATAVGRGNKRRLDNVLNRSTEIGENSSRRRRRRDRSACSCCRKVEEREDERSIRCLHDINRGS